MHIGILQELSHYIDKRRRIDDAELLHIVTSEKNNISSMILQRFSTIFESLAAIFDHFCGYFATILQRFGIIHWLYNDSTKIIRRFYNDYTTITMITTILQRFCIKTWKNNDSSATFRLDASLIVIEIKDRWDNS